jgi:FtsP/CotA-like multicopper oxidase with cupredoxin domain
MNVMTKGSIAAVFLFCVSLAASAQESSINIQCPTSTPLHAGPDGIKCMHLVAGDGMVTMADENYEGTTAGKPLYVFSFARLPGEGRLYPDPGDPDLSTEIPQNGEAAFAGAPNDPGYPAWVMENGILAANAPAPTIIVDEDDEFFLSLTNAGMAIRPDLFDPHTVHWHGFPNASSVFDGVPDSSVSINMGATLTYYYLAKDAGTYMYHCHVEAAEHMQMGMLGNLYVRPRQNKCLTNGTTCPAGHVAGYTYAYNDGDGTTRYDFDVPIQLGSFDPDFHDASFNVQPLPFAGMRDRYFLMNGRGYPDTVKPGVLSTVDALGKTQYSQPVSSLISATAGQKILLRISNLNVTQFSTISTNGISMRVVGLDARLLRDDGGSNMYYDTHTLTLGGGQSADVILDTTGHGGQTLFLYTTNLHQLANDAENFGGMMTEIRIN